MGDLINKARLRSKKDAEKADAKVAEMTKSACKPPWKRKGRKCVRDKNPKQKRAKSAMSAGKAALLTAGAIGGTVVGANLVGAGIIAAHEMNERNKGRRGADNFVSVLEPII